MSPIPRTATEVDCSSWMSRLPDSAKLDELYIPGTHESLALFFPLLGSRCQSTSLTSQLHGGIRFLDLRFSLLSKTRPLRFSRREEEQRDEEEWELWGYHGVVPQLKRAETVFEEVYRWLEGEEGRRETVIVSCKQENAAPSHLFASALWTLLDRRRDLWYDEERWPSLGEARGKCVMFCRFGFDGRGLHPPIWPNDALAAWTTEIGEKEVLVQDWYGLPSILAIPQKASLALSLFDPPVLSPSSSSPSPAPPSLSPTSPLPHPTASSAVLTALPSPTTPLRLSFLSSSSFPLAPPSLCAKGFGFPRWRLGFYGVNALFLAGLRQRTKEGEKAPTGRGRRYEEGEGGMVVMMDFWEEPRGLVQEIIGMNLRGEA
ncbi:hypothetical protein JCM8547_003605 [Rhodosporidiobolus lusitaniae]